MKESRSVTEINTYLADVIQDTEYRSKYDRAAKHLVANRPVLARIIKSTTTEFADYDVDEIEDCIEGTPLVAQVNVYPEKVKSQKITGQPTKSEIPKEGKITFDIRLTAITRKKERIKIMLNVEVQKKYHVGYHFVPRGVFYCARMISEQLDTEFTAEDYDNIKKVYSIWICMEAPEFVANTITKYELKPEDVYGEFKGIEKYDLISIQIIRLSKKENMDTGNDLIRMLTVLLSHKMDAETKKKILEEEHGMKMTEEMMGGMRGMCNLSELVWEEGFENGEKIGKEIGKEIGQTIARCNVIRMLSKTMAVSAISELVKYEECFVKAIVELLCANPNATDEEIVGMMKSA